MKPISFLAATLLAYTSGFAGASPAASNQKRTVANPLLRGYNGICTFTNTRWVISKTTLSVTKTAKPCTTTRVVFSTTTQTSIGSAVTSTFSSTSTLYVTNNITQTAVDTSTSITTTTFTTTPPTSTVPPPAGFTPIKSVFPQAKKRDVLDSVPRAASSLGLCVKAGDVQRCTSTIKSTLTRTITKSVTKTATASAQLVTKTLVKVITTVTTVLPTPASTTSTFFTTSTVNATIITTSTTTVNATATATEFTGPTSTFYAACDTNNILTQYNGQFVSALYYAPPGSSISLGTFATAYDCCVACLLNSNCAGAGWIASSICIGATPDVTCDGSLISSNFGAYSPTDVGWAVSNSGCGQWGYQA